MEGRIPSFHMRHVSPISSKELHSYKCCNFLNVVYLVSRENQPIISGWPHYPSILEDMLLIRRDKMKRTVGFVNNILWVPYACYGRMVQVSSSVFPKYPHYPFTRFLSWNEAGASRAWYQHCREWMFWVHNLHPERAIYSNVDITL